MKMMQNMETMQPMQMNDMPERMPRMRTRRIAIGTGVVILGGVAWYLFRPELLIVNKTVNESLPTATVATDGKMSGMILASGMFHTVAHETKGTATIHRIGGKNVLRLTDFQTSNGPDVHVYLTMASDAKDNDDVINAGFVDVGSLKGNIGDQNYELPENIDLSKFHAVTVWCKRFSVNFGTAPLAMN
jgi:hypothetical protein